MFYNKTLLDAKSKIEKQFRQDKEKYEIMKKVGMNTKEIKKSIRFQVLSVFFLPILVAIIHFVFLSKTIASLALQITNITIFQTCSIATILTFCIFYTIVYFYYHTF